MARRSSALATALQAALAGFGGGAVGYAKDEATRDERAERERLRKEREEESRYRRELDAANLMQQGFMGEDQLDAKRKAAGPSMVKHVLDSVNSMMSPGSAPPSAEGMDRTVREGGIWGPSSGVTVGDRSFVLPESRPAREERLATADRGERRAERQVGMLARERERAEDRAQSVEDRKASERLQRDLVAARNQGDVGLTPQQRYDKLMDTFLTKPVQELVTDPIFGQRAINRAPTAAEVAAYKALLRQELLGEAPAAAERSVLEVEQSSAPPMDSLMTWFRKNKRQPGESDEAYAARARAGVR
jgi:hypothetical protein